MITFATEIKPFYLIIIILIIGCFLDIFYVAFFKPVININKVKNEITYHLVKNKLPYTLEKTKEDGANFKLLISGKEYLIKVVIVPKNCDLQINNIDTWLCYIKASSDSMKTKLVNNLTTFMKSKKENRIIMLSNSAKTIKKVINECEMIMVKPETDVYKTHIINFNNISEFISKQIF